MHFWHHMPAASARTQTCALHASPGVRLRNAVLGIVVLLGEVLVALVQVKV
jgi:hypothetical protein